MKIKLYLSKIYLFKTQFKLTKIYLFFSKDRRGYYSKGWFKAVRTGKHRFVASADNKFYMVISKTPNVVNHSLLTKAIDIRDWVNFRTYKRDYQYSEYYDFVAGNYYYFETTATNRWEGHHTLSVEVPSDTFQINSLYGILLLKISSAQVKEKLRVRMMGARSGTWKFSIGDKKSKHPVEWGWEASWMLNDALNSIHNFDAKVISIKYLDEVIYKNIFIYIYFYLKYKEWKNNPK